MTTVFPCYSSQDKPFASELASFLTYVGGVLRLLAPYS